MDLFDLGWNSSWESAFRQLQPAPEWQPARICRHDRLYTVLTAEGTVFAVLSGRFLHQQPDALATPAVGDWVALEWPPGTTQARIQAVLPRTSLFARKVAGKESAPQVVAANIDRLLLVSGLDDNFNLRRIERYLAVASQSGAEPVIVLNKLDLCPDPEAVIAAVEEIAAGTPVVPVSATEGAGLDLLAAFLRPGQTAAVLGSSGVGKSTLLNALLGEARQAVQANREGDSRGRHTTTARELFLLPGGAILIDTPGMRELGLVEQSGELGEGFADLEELAGQCRFRDCTHEAEPGCALQEALAAGTLDPARLESWQRLKREEDYAARRRDAFLERQANQRWKQISKRARQEDVFLRKQRDR